MVYVRSKRHLRVHLLVGQQSAAHPLSATRMCHLLAALPQAVLLTAYEKMLVADPDNAALSAAVGEVRLISPAGRGEEGPACSGGRSEGWEGGHAA